MKNKMMIRRILIGLFLGIVVTSCTHNDGYIGPLFGKWQLIEMWENGTLEEYAQSVSSEKDTIETDPNTSYYMPQNATDVSTFTGSETED